MRLHEEAGATNTLNTLVERCRNLLINDPDALGRWEAALTSAGYSPAHQEEYSKLHWRIVDEFLYAVTDDFPRLIRENLTNGLPMGVDGVGYDIHLDGFASLVVQPNEVGTLLSAN